MNGRKANLSDEIRIIPWWAWTLAVVVFVCAQVFIHHLVLHEHNPPPRGVAVWMGFVLGIVMFVYFLFLGYVNVDAGRRGMSRALWTVVVMFIPNALGFILYFLMRQPLQATCPQCSTRVETGFNFCPKCNFRLTPTCPGCQRTVHLGDVYCPYCGSALSAGAPGKAPA
jgi:RNA polymerase subunit RPABC4/transcription elongation factor Spt4